MAQPRLDGWSSCLAGTCFVCWFHGSGERTADDVGPRRALRNGIRTWSAPFLLADTPGIPGYETDDLLAPERLLADVADDSRQRMHRR